MLRATTSKRLMLDRRGVTAMEYAMIMAAAGPVVAAGFSAYAGRFKAYLNVLIASLP